MAEQNLEKKSDLSEGLCSHYTRACSLVAPCCNKTYPCRLCHDEKEAHEIDRFAVKQVMCRKCHKTQPVAESCVQCSVKFARYVCLVCNLFDDAEKGQYHCVKCGICRIGGRDNFIHCDVCGLCLLLSLKETHKCVQEASRSNCPVCMDDIHTSRNPAHVPDCGHLLHKKCFTEMLENGLYQCPQCQTSLIKMSNHWENMDNERQRWVLPLQLRDFTVKIQCRDCRTDSDAAFHFIGLKCIHCGSYNTVRNGNETLPLEDVDPANTNEEEIVYFMDPLDFIMSSNQQLPISSSDSDDEYETPPSNDITDDDDFDDEEELYYAEQLLGGIPLLPPWFPQHSNNIDINNLTNQLFPFHLNHDGSANNGYNSEHVPNGDWDNSLELSPYVQLANSLLPTGLFQHDHDSDSGSPHVWEIPFDDIDGDDEYEDGEEGGVSDEWETDSEEEVIGGDEENLGKEDCQVLIKDESNQIDEIAPAN